MPDGTLVATSGDQKITAREVRAIVGLLQPAQPRMDDVDPEGLVKQLFLYRTMAKAQSPPELDKTPQIRALLS